MERSCRAKQLVEMALSNQHKRDEDVSVERSVTIPDTPASCISSPAPSLDEDMMSLYNELEYSDEDRTYIPYLDSDGSSSEFVGPTTTIHTNHSIDNLVPSTSRGTDACILPPVTRKPYVTPTEIEAPISVFKTLKPWSRKAREQRKELLHTGQEYTTVKGKKVKARDSKNLPACRNKCSLKLTTDVRRALFEDYWRLGSYDKRAAYVASLINTKPKKTMRVRVNDTTKIREITHTYFFEINGSRTSVCKACFCATLDEKPRFLRTIMLKKKTSVAGIPSPDARGKQPPPHKKSEAELEDAKLHILSFPSYESHYTRRTNDKKYLPSHLNLRIMYDLFCKDKEKPLSRKIYEKIFHSLKLSFKRPKQDTCHSCDLFMMKLKIAEDKNNENEIVMIKDQHDQHLKNADAAYAMKKKDKEEARVDAVHKACFAFDLQQCLPTPFLGSSVVFYKRQLWTFNLTVHDVVSGDSTNFMWHEGLAYRGGNEIASCLYHFLKNKLPPTVNEVTFYSDTCGGQNKNSHVSAMFLKVIEDLPNLTILNHKFLVSGHTHMECDIDHALIEKNKKKTKFPIYHPHDWSQLVRSAGKKNIFTVYEMQRNDFYDFAKLFSSQLVLRKKNDDGITLKWHDAKWFQYRSTNPRILFYKTDLNGESFNNINFQRRGRASNSLSVTHRYNSPIPISVEKKRDIISLLPLIPPIFHDFYNNLSCSNGSRDRDPDLEETEVDD